MPEVTLAFSKSHMSVFTKNLPRAFLIHQNRFWPSSLKELPLNSYFTGLHAFTAALEM